MKKYYFTLLILLFGTLNIYADDISFIVDAPSSVVKGSQFRLQYILKSGGESAGNIDLDQDIKGFNVIYGPSTSQMSSTSIVNGKVSSENNTTYTYILEAKKEGTFNIPAAKITVAGRNYTSNTTSIKVLPPDKNAKSQGLGSQITSSSSTIHKISPNDAFIRAIFSKTRVDEQEAIVVTYRLYTVLNIKNIGKVNFPEFDGFMTEEFNLPENRQIHLENYKGRNYYAIDIKKTLLFPQKSGMIKIPSGTMDVIFEIKTGQQEETFFGVEDIMANVNKTLNINPVTVNVDPLPSKNKPLNFSGAVGTFNFSSSISTQKVKANDAVTIKLDISGTGNMKLIKNPNITLPDDFETYDPKVTSDANLTNDGLSGKKTIEYLFIPRHEGKYVIDPVKFTYFDIKSRTYKTLTSPSYTLDVAKDPNAGLNNNNSGISFSNQKEVTVQNDIRYIKTNKIVYTKIGQFLYGSAIYLIIYLIFIILFIASFIFYRKQIKQNANAALMKTKRANKVAAKKLKIAKSYLQTRNKDKFYEELLKAVWGYLSDKILIPAANLNRENIENELMKYGATDVLIKQFISILDDCEFARYAPSNSEGEMDKIYNQTISAIGTMENTIKKLK